MNIIGMEGFVVLTPLYEVYHGIYLSALALIADNN